MKNKKFATKLTLRKETVSNLDNRQMANLKGGKDTTTCPIPATHLVGCTATTCDLLICNWTLQNCTYYHC